MRYKVFLIWKADDHKGEYIPIGALEDSGRKFKFYYIEGIKKAQKLGYVLLPEFPDINEIYQSNEIFPLFANRLMSRSRRNIKDYLDSMDIKKEGSPLLELGRSNGKRVTDRYRVISLPEKARGKFSLIFFVHGLTKPPVNENIEMLLSNIKEGEQLLLTPQVQNIYDPNAIMMHTTIENRFVGWIPAYYAAEVQQLLLQHPHEIECRVVKINPPDTHWVPDRLLVKLTGPWPSDWRPFESVDFQPVKHLELALSP